MNQRIFELAKQASEWYEQNVSGKGISGEWETKFAELIVKECANVCLSQRDPANLNYKPSERFAEAVKQHFGIEK
jgi:hypothetical protein